MLRTQHSQRAFFCAGIALAVATCFSWASSPSGAVAVDLSLLDSGKLSLNELVYVLGPPASTYLAGNDSEFSNPQPTDALIVRWETTILLESPLNADVSVALRPGTALIRAITVLVPDSVARPTIEQLLAAYPGESREVRMPCVGDDLECSPQSCADANGEIHAVFVPSQGLQAFVDLDGRIDLITISMDLVESGFPPACDSPQN